MRILMLAHFYPPEMGGAGARLHGLARWLRQYGHEVTVIAGFPNYPTGTIPEQYRGKLWTREEMDGVEVIRTWVYTSPKRGGMRRLANYFSFVGASAVAGALAAKQFDVVLASSPPLFIGLAGLFLARVRRASLIFDVRDIWPELAVEAGEFKPDATMVVWGERLERFLYRQANQITVVTRRKEKKLLDKGVPAHKLHIVSNGVDIDVLQPKNLEDWRQKFELGDKFVAVYAGLIGIFQGVDVIVHAAKLLKEQPHIHFLIVGDGVKRADLEAEAAKHNLTNITFVPPQPREAIPDILHAADVALVPLVNEQLVDAVPSKLLEAWGCRRPVVLMAGGEARRLMEESGGGRVIAPGSATELAATLTEMAVGDPADLDRYADRGYKYVAENFDRPKLARQMETVLQAEIGVELAHAERA
ncbi:MAG: glycosyltransferase family 4 protein [Caldilineaceae bacterium]|nr:glycosyltransferase family 4 protein [Caldilineaceae bacterium]